MQLDKISARGEKAHVYRAVIETSRGSRNKYSYDPKERVFVMRKVLPQGHVFPFDFGFIPGTKAEDGDPIDVLVMMDEPAFPGCVVECRMVGVFQAKQLKKGKWVRNDRLIAVAESSLNFKRIKSLQDLEPDMVEQLEYFFISYLKAAGKEIKALKLRGAADARATIEAALPVD